MLKVMKFWAPWCGPCKVFAPIMEEIKQDNPDVEFVDINVDTDKDTPGRFGIMGVPTVLIFKDNEQVHKFGGSQGKEFIQDLINKYK